MPADREPLRVALVDDYDVVVVGVANMLEPYRDRVVIAELDTGRPVQDEVDVVLYDSFAQPESDHEEIAVLVAKIVPTARRMLPNIRGKSRSSSYLVMNRLSSCPWPRLSRIRPEATKVKAYAKTP